MLFWANLVFCRALWDATEQSGQFGALDPGFSGTIHFNLGFAAPGVYHLLWSPDLDEGSPTGCLWWSPMGGEVTYMHHILRGGCEP